MPSVAFLLVKIDLKIYDFTKCIVSKDGIMLRTLKDKGI
jgi:hypothetical protein